MDQALEQGRRFAALLAAKRWPQLRDLLDPAIDFKGVTPSRLWPAGTADEVVTGVLQRWFDATDDIERSLGAEVGRVVDRCWLRYRYEVRNGDGLHRVEQHGYYDVGDDGRIRRLQLMCAGYRPIG